MRHRPIDISPPDPATAPAAPGQPAGGAGDGQARGAGQVPEPDRAVLPQAPLLQFLLDSTLHPVLILDRSMVVVQHNTRLLELVGADMVGRAVGLHFGEMLGCLNSLKPGSAGCGATEACGQCGVLGAVRDVVGDLGAVGDVTREFRTWRLGPHGPEAVDLRVTASTLPVDGKPYVVLTTEDISHEKRLLTLDRLFFHDILNTVGGLRGILGLIEESFPPRTATSGHKLIESLGSVYEEIQAHKHVLAAERGELVPAPRQVSSTRLLTEALALAQANPSHGDRAAILDQGSPESQLATDPAIARHVLWHMTCAAMQAAGPGGTVVVGARLSSRGVKFQASTRTELPREILLRMFKGPRDCTSLEGLCAYAMKILAERCLSGRAECISLNGQGTVFSIELPRPGADN